MKDFTLKIYKRLISAFMQSGYPFITFAEFMQLPGKGDKTIILRHDVDKKPLRSLKTAEMENDLGVKGTYYFRVSKGGFPSGVVVRIAKLGHEIGYHYDDLNAADGDAEFALKLFQDHLAMLRELAPVKTICMHGSPLSRHDNRKIWGSRQYREFEVIGEPYFDIDFSEVLYLTDTGRRWDGAKVSVRDKVSGNGFWSKKIPRLHSTMDIISALKKRQLPDTIMLTVHPQRWTDISIFWFKELIWQKMKNVIKYAKIKRTKKKQ